MDRNIVISVKTILYVFLMVAGIYVLFRLGTIIGLLCVALLITLSFEHAIKFFSKQTLLNRPIGRPLAVLITYLLAFLLLSIAITLGLDPLVTQTQKLIQTLSRHEGIRAFGGNIEFSFSTILEGVLSTSGGIFSATKSIFNNVAAIFSVLILSIYMSIDWVNIKSKLLFLFKEKDRGRVTKTFEEIERNIGVWLKGQLILMIVIGVFSYIGLLLVGVKYPLALALMAGIFEIVPIIGPILSAVIAALVAVVDSPVKAVLIVGLFALIQQAESNILVPKVMQKVSGFSPIVILIALLAGNNLFGLIGAVAAVPVLMIGGIIVRSIMGVEK